MGVIVVSGTGTGVGKTVVTAALAALAADNGQRVAVVKPAQTGATQGEPGDIDEIRRLAQVTDLHELARFRYALAPEASARLSQRPAVDLAQAARLVGELAADRDLVLIEGAGGLAVRYDACGTTIADLAGRLGASVLVVATAGLGTLNHTALTLAALSARGLQCAGVVIGAWPARPDLAMRCNLADLRSIAGRPLAGVVPDGAGALDPARFITTARNALAPEFGGTFDPAEFEQRHGWPNAGKGDT